jgi:hypothetical protein
VSDEHQSGVERARQAIGRLTLDPSTAEAVAALLGALEGVHGSVEAAHMNIRDLESPPVRALPGNSAAREMVEQELGGVDGWPDGDPVPVESVTALMRVVRRLASELDDARAELRTALREMDQRDAEPGN